MRKEKNRTVWQYVDMIMIERDSIHLDNFLIIQKVNTKYKVIERIIRYNNFSL